MSSVSWGSRRPWVGAERLRDCILPVGAQIIVQDGAEVNPGDTEFLEGDHIDRVEFWEVNQRRIARGFGRAPPPGRGVRRGAGILQPGDLGAVGARGAHSFAVNPERAAARELRSPG